MGLQLSRFAPAIWQRLRRAVSPLTSVDNPVDVAWGVGDYAASREILQAVIADEGVDGITISLDGSNLSLPFVRALLEIAPDCGKPVTVSLGLERGSADVQPALLEEKGIPTYPVPERAVTGLAGLVRYGDIQRRFK